MQHISDIYMPHPSFQAGGRISSDAHRQSIDFSSTFEGLEEGSDRYELLLLVKKVGKAAGFSPRMIQLLDYYMAYTRDCDWEEGSRPIVFQSVSRTALDLGVSERQIQKLERSMFKIGALTWNDSGNHRRYGQRDPRTGQLLYAYGVELTPLASLKPILEQKLAEKHALAAQWMETKRQISWYRSQIRGLILEQREQGSSQALVELEQRYNTIAIQIRSHLSLEQLQSLLAEHRSLHGDVMQVVGNNTAKTKPCTQRASIPKETDNSSSISDQKFVHYKSTNQKPFNKLNTSNPAGNCLQKGVADTAVTKDPFHSSGIDHIKIGMATSAASERFQAFLPSDPNWSDVVEAAYHIRTDLGISQANWGRGCQLLGRTGTAICIIITDRAKDRETDRVRSPAAYFNGMLKRAEKGELHLHKSIFGMM